MEDTEKPTEGVTGNPQLKTKISYCPKMDIYRYSQAGEDECFFDTPMLEMSIDVHLKNGDERNATFMAQLSSFARKWPHCDVSFFDDGSFKIEKLQTRKFEGDDPANENVEKGGQDGNG